MRAKGGFKESVTVHHGKLCGKISGFELHSLGIASFLAKWVSSPSHIIVIHYSTPFLNLVQTIIAFQCVELLLLEALQQ